MEPRIQYAITTDGVNIAYAVTGNGPVMVLVPAPPDNHLQLEWENPYRRSIIEQVSRYRTVVRFDGRGSGLSDRGLSSYTLEDRLRDLEAVLERVAPGEPVTLVSGTHGNQLTVAYAAKHPERVSHVVAIQPFVQGQDFLPPEQFSLMEEILRRDFDTFTEMIGAMLFGWGDEQGPQYGAFFRASVTQRDANVIYIDMLNVDLAPLLPRVQCPLMVGYYEGADLSNGTSVRRFAALAPHSGLQLLRERPSEGASPDLLRDIGAFLGERWEIKTPPRPGRRSETRSHGTVRTILFTDIENHTHMMNELGDRGGRAVLRDHERITRAVLSDHDGVEVKTVGDSFIASFGSATRALECAIALQRAFARRNSEANVPIAIRIGLNAGEPIEEDDDLFGTSVIAASRIKDKARGGQIFVANVVRELVAGKRFLFADLGEQVLRGLEDPVRIYELRWD